MEKVEDIVRVGERGQITIPISMRETQDLEKGDFLKITNIGGIITLRRIEAKPNILDMFSELGEELKRKGYTSRKKLIRLAEEVKEEVTKGWEKG